MSALTRAMTQSFGRECLLLKNVLNRGSAGGAVPTEMDAIMRAWVYYRMLTDRVETVYHREKMAYILGAPGKRGNWGVARWVSPFWKEVWRCVGFGGCLL